MIRDAFDHPSRLAVAMLVGIVVLAALTAWQNRRYLARANRKQCHSCGALFGSNARFCGRCGKAF